MKMVGAVGFEPTTSCTRNKRATRLRYAPTQGYRICPHIGEMAMLIFRDLGTAVDWRINLPPKLPAPK